MADDQHRAAEVIKRGMRDRWGTAFDPSHNPDLDDLWTSYMTDGAYLLVAVDPDRSDVIVGTGALVPDPAGARIVRMSVDPTNRRQGVATTIVEALLDRARTDRCRTVVVSTDTPWTDAVALYASCGFTTVGEWDGDTHFAFDLTLDRDTTVEPKFDPPPTH